MKVHVQSDLIDGIVLADPDLEMEVLGSLELPNGEYSIWNLTKNG